MLAPVLFANRSAIAKAVSPEPPIDEAWAAAANTYLDEAENTSLAPNSLIEMATDSQPAAPSPTRLELKNFSASNIPELGMLDLRFEAKAAPLLVTVMNPKGQEVQRLDMPSFNGYFQVTLDLSAEPKGLYLILIKQGGQSYNHSVIMQ